MRTHVLRIAAAASLAALAAGCVTTTPFSQLDGHRQRTVEMNTFDVLVISVDGRDVVQQGRLPINIEPGQRRIVVQGPPVAGFRYGQQRTLDLKVEPCMRYWLEAKKDTPLAQDFVPRVNYSEPIAGCTNK